MIKPEIDLELSIKALKVYGIEPNIIESMLTNLQKLVKNNAVSPHIGNNELAVCDCTEPDSEDGNGNKWCSKCFKIYSLAIQTTSK